jgi:hypothetical protein
MTGLHPFPPATARSEFEWPSIRSPSYAVHARSEVNGVTQSMRGARTMVRRVGARCFSLTNHVVLFNRAREIRL